MKLDSHKEQGTRKAKKLKLNRQTIKDLKTDDKRAENIKGGMPADDGGEVRVRSNALNLPCGNA